VRAFIARDPVRPWRTLFDGPTILSRLYAVWPVRAAAPATVGHGLKDSRRIQLPSSRVEKLKEDDSNRFAIALRTLNDISKDHPDVVLDLCERGMGIVP